MNAPLRFSRSLETWLAGRPDWVREAVSLPLHDTHEHLQTEIDWLKSRPNPLYLYCQYLPGHLATAGATETEVGWLPRSAGQLDERFDRWEDDWRLLAPYLDSVRTAGYGQALRRATELLFDEDAFDLAGLRRISEKMSAAKPGDYAKILDAAAIHTTQTHAFDANVHGRLPMRRDPEPARFLSDLAVDYFFYPRLIHAAEREKNIQVTGPESWLALVRLYFTDDAPHCVAVKCGLGYSSDLAFPPASEKEAAEAWRHVWDLDRGAGVGCDPTMRSLFLGWGIRKVIELAREHDLPVKFHTGQYSGAGDCPLHLISRNLSNLERLIRDYQDATFVLLHHAYPYGEAAVSLAQSYRRVFVDQSWLWTINPAAASRYLREFILGAPRNKLFLFGGDYWRIENIPGHADLARHGLGLTLWNLVKESWLTPDEALGWARACCHQNQEAVFPRLDAFRISKN